MVHRIKAWFKILKIMMSLTKIREAREFYKGNLVKVLDKEGLFNFLNIPKSLDEIVQYFNYKDVNLVSTTLEALRKDKILSVTPDSKFFFKNHKLGRYPEKSRILSDSLLDIMLQYVDYFPERLRGKFADFTGGINLFNWDDALTDSLYEQMRRSAFSYVNATKYEGTFLEIGTGAGYSTAAIFNYYLKAKKFYPETKMKIIGIDTDESLLTIAREEFPKMLAKHSNKTESEIDSLKDYYPKFQQASVTELPYDDNSFDMIYSSQVLHWTNTPKAIREMLRVTKPNGFVFGAQSVAPRVNHYANSHVIVVKDAQGFFTREQFIKWAKEAGARKVKTSYPLITVCFKFLK
ncbi:MAG: class I SAM-dependent methyltransferase [Candidatus Hermodarchaeota archaeon]